VLPSLAGDDDDLLFVVVRGTPREIKDSDFDGWGIRLTFSDFLFGMVEVQRNERTAGWVDIDKPNRWELLSLIIDTPVSKDAHKKIVDGMSGLEKLGIKMVR